MKFDFIKKTITIDEPVTLRDFLWVIEEKIESLEGWKIETNIIFEPTSVQFIPGSTGIEYNFTVRQKFPIIPMCTN